MSIFPTIRKAIAGLLTAVATWGATAAPDGIQAVEWWGLVGVVGVFLAVFGTTNEPTAPLPDEDGYLPRDGGQSAVDLLIKVLCVVILAVFAWYLVAHLIAATPG